MLYRFRNRNSATKKRIHNKPTTTGQKRTRLKQDITKENQHEVLHMLRQLNFLLVGTHKRFYEHIPVLYKAFSVVYIILQ